MRINNSDAKAALARKSFLFFLRCAVGEIGGLSSYTHNWHIDAIAYQLDRITRGETTRLIVTMPPRHLKSLAITTAWVAWMLGQQPALRFICPSYGQHLAEKPARDCLRIMQTDWYRKAFPATRLVRTAVEDFETSAGGGRLSTSVGGVMTGRGADIVIIDDPIKADEALSEARREDVTEWFFTALTSRLNDQAKSSIIVVMQRLHEGDLAGELLSRGGWDELRLPAIAVVDKLIPLTNGRFHQRRVGCALHPERQSLATLLKKQADDPYVFAAQFQQDPVSRIGAFVNQEWFKTYDERPRSGVVVQSWDTASKTTVRSAWSVGITALFYEGRYYILDVFRARVTFTQLLEQVRSSCIKYKVERLLIEDASSGQQLIEQLNEKHCPGVPYPISVTPYEDKITRFEAQASKIESGVIVLPRGAPWAAEFVGELTKFPGGNYKDQADALAQMLANPPPHRSVLENAGPIIVHADDPDDEPYGELGGDNDPWLSA